MGKLSNIEFTCGGSDEETGGEQVPTPGFRQCGYASVEDKSGGQQSHRDHGQDADGFECVAQIAHQRAEEELRQWLGGDKQSQKLRSGFRIHLYSTISADLIDFNRFKLRK